MKTSTYEYSIIGWLVTVIFGFIIDLILIWNKSCLSEYVGLKKAWWTECKTLAASSVAHTSPVNLGDTGTILALAVIGLVIGGLYGKIKNRN